MPNSKSSPVNTKVLPPNIMDLRDDAFYDFIRQFSGKKVAELLAFQECNSVDSFLGCDDVTALLQLKSDQLDELKKNVSITLIDGSTVLLPGIQSSIINLEEVLSKKREEVNKQSERLRSIDSSNRSTSRMTSNTSLTTSTSISHRSIHPPTSSHASSSLDQIDVSSHLMQSTFICLTDDKKKMIKNTIIDWLNKKKVELNLMNINFEKGADFRLELNKQQDGIIVCCKCGVKNALGQKHGVLLVSNSTFFFFKSANTLVSS